MLADPSCSMISSIEKRRGIERVYSKERLDDPFATVLLVTLVGKFDQDRDKLSVRKQQDAFAVGAIGSYPQFVS